MKLYQKIIAGGLVVAGLAGLLGCDSKIINHHNVKKRLKQHILNQFPCGMKQVWL